MNNYMLSLFYFLHSNFSIFFFACSVSFVCQYRNLSNLVYVDHVARKPVVGGSDMVEPQPATESS